MITLRRAQSTDLPAIKLLLRGEALPLGGVEAALDGLVVADRSGEVVGVGGLERRGDVALLRSLAVARAGRGAGLGQRLVARLLDQAREGGVTSLWLLTEGAEGFFEHFGFRPVSRDQVPEAIRTSHEFSEACPATATVMVRRVAPLGILVICTANSARSQIAEALLRHRGGDLIRAASAGTAPGPGPHPLAVDALAGLGIDWAGHRSKSLDEVGGDWDLVITVCDDAQEACPVVPGRLMVHWGLPDPAAVQGDRAECMAAFTATAAELDLRIGALLALPLGAMTNAEVAERTRGSTSNA